MINTLKIDEIYEAEVIGLENEGTESSECDQNYEKTDNLRK